MVKMILMMCMQFDKLMPQPYGLLGVRSDTPCPHQWTWQWTLSSALDMAMPSPMDMDLVPCNVMASLGACTPVFRNAICGYYAETQTVQVVTDLNWIFCV